MTRIAVVGAGISGLSIAKILSEGGHDVTVFEKNSYHGGLVHCTIEQGILFHRVGGHVFNTKIKEVSDWFWSHFSQEDFIPAKRNAKIWIDKQFVGYPIENFIYQLPKDRASQIIQDLISTNQFSDEPSDFENFLLQKFGKSLYDYYFRPYNYKIWRTDLSKIPLPWLDGKLPMPNLHEIFMNNIFKQDDEGMVHSFFYYPCKGGSSFIADVLAEDLKIQYNYQFSAYKSQNQWIVGDDIFDFIIYTGDIRKVKDVIHFNEIDFECIADKCKSFKSNGTSNALCYIDRSDLSWLYLPESTTDSHRIIFTGNFSPNNNQIDDRLTCTVEFSGNLSETEMRRELSKLPFHLDPIAFNHEPNSYVIQNVDTRQVVSEMKNYLETHNMYLLGRFAEWEYYNMDKVIEAALILYRDKFGSS